MSDPTRLKLRPKMDRWLRDRGLGPSFLGARWKITPQGASRYLLPFDNPRRIVPNQAQMEDAAELTEGDVLAADWFPPHLQATGSARLAEPAQ